MSKVVLYVLNTSETQLKHKPNMLYFYVETTKTLEKESSNAGAIAGGVIGACVVLVIFAGILFLRYHSDAILQCLTNVANSNHIY